MTLMEDARVENTVVAIVEDLIQDWGLSLEGKISGRTMLVNDLGFGSVDVIQLCVAIEQHFDRKLGFHELLMEDGSYITDLSISQISSFVNRRLDNRSKIA